MGILSMGIHVEVHTVKSICIIAYIIQELMSACRAP